SRRRQTRFSRDWSSDVCSSDLVSSDLVAVTVHANSLRGAENRYIVVSDDDGRTWTRRDSSSVRDPIGHLAVTGSIVAAVAASGELGRASCRARGEEWAGRGAGL